MVRTPCCEKSGLKKGAWTAEEDKKLVAYITRYGHWNWRELPKFAGLSRCGKSCRLRWMNYLRPNIKRGNFTREEDEIIIKMHKALGNKWAAISEKLPGRTDNEIKNHWHTDLKKSLKQNMGSSESKPHNSESGSECNDNSKQDLSLQTLESSPLSPVPSLSDFSSSSTDSILGTSMDWLTDGYTVSSDKFADLNGDLWTESYMVGSSYIEENFFPQTWVDPGVLYPLYHPFSIEESLSTYESYEDNYMELFN